jgi:hypothetical protein
MEGPANTVNYMIAGYVVIFGSVLSYLASLVLRHRSLRHDQALLKDLEQKED